MNGGRIDLRTSVGISAKLMNLSAPAGEERVFIENVSLHGARVIAHHRFEPATPVLLSAWKEFTPIEGAVVYCERVGSKAYAVGLQFRGEVHTLAP